jgi:nucleotide-binding universal stress UspA family protein
MRKILLAYDGTEPAKKALFTAVDLVKTHGAELAVISVVPVHPGRVGMDPWDDGTAHTRMLVEARAMLREHGIAPQMLKPAGDPAITIEHIAEEGGFDTIVIGSRSLGPVARALEGSVSEHVATHARGATVVIAR